MTNHEKEYEEHLRTKALAEYLITDEDRNAYYYRLKKNEEIRYKILYRSLDIVLKTGESKYADFSRKIKFTPKYEAEINKPCTDKIIYDKPIIPKDEAETMLDKLFNLLVSWLKKPNLAKG